MRKLLLVGLVAISGVLTAAPPVYAQSATFNLTPINPATGQWHVTVANTGVDNWWNINVIALNPPGNVSANVQRIEFTFTNPDAATWLNPTGAIGVKSASAGTQGIAPGSTYNPWLIENPTLFDPDVDATNPLMGWFTTSLSLAGNNFFTGTVQLKGNKADVKHISMNAYGGLLYCNAWTGGADIGSNNAVPEGSSLAMLLPGLLPVGLLRRRRIH